jgi:PIN domain nuclease of toxin-antitoxin system
LPLHHHDPFDRILPAQVRVEGLTLLSSDRAMSTFDAPVRW